MSDSMQCDGERPCSRCRSRGEQCQYHTRSHQAKRSLRAEIDELKGAQRQRDDMLGALAAPGQTHDVLENLGTHGSASPTPNQVSDASSQHQDIKEEPSLTLTWTSLCFPQVLDYSNSTDLHRSETSHIQSAVNNQNSILNYTKKEADGLAPHLETSMFSHMALPNSIMEYSAAEYTPTLPFGMFMKHNTLLLPPNACHPNKTYATDDIVNINWWQPGISDPMLLNSAVSSSVNHAAWPHPQLTAHHLPSQTTANHLQSSSTPPQVNNSSPLMSCPSPRGNLPGSVGSSSIANAGGSRYPTPSPLKKQKLSTSDPASSITITAAIGSDCKSTNNGPADGKAQSKSLKPPSHDHERHRQASARNWQKQKKHASDLEAAMNVAETRNRELHREYADVSSQVMDAKNVLMDHAKCNHPAIGSWLRSQATKYVLNKGAAVDAVRKGSDESEDMAVSTYLAERKRAVCT
ncbi:hypothetical protein LZ30DRAFT_737069 [Colletotrichum cereale]|nr:hypothetical protein LZ30DRAFT_737069 [Colletotrichum cereale]